MVASSSCHQLSQSSHACSIELLTPFDDSPDLVVLASPNNTLTLLMLVNGVSHGYNEL